MVSPVPIIFVIGSPGAGKGTLCERLAYDHGLSHVSVGDVSRRAASSPDADESLVEHVRRSELLPTDMLLSVLEPHLQRDGTTNGNRGILLDGFPRRHDQADAFEQRFGRPLLVLFFDCPREAAEQRVVQRRLGRAGDNHDMFRKRYAEFVQLNPLVLDRYDGEELAVVDTRGPSDVSYDKLIEILNKTAAWPFSI